MIQKLNIEELTILLNAASLYIKAQRNTAGQAAFKALKELRPDIANIIRGTDIDPFYHNIRLGAFYRYICDNDAYNYFIEINKKQ